MKRNNVGNKSSLFGKKSKATPAATAAAAAASSPDVVAAASPPTVVDFNELRLNIRKSLPFLKLVPGNNGRTEPRLFVGTSGPRMPIYQTPWPLQAFYAKLSGEGDAGMERKRSAGEEGGGDGGGGAGDGKEIIQRKKAHFTIGVHPGDEGFVGKMPELLDKQNEHFDDIEALAICLLTELFETAPKEYMPAVQAALSAARYMVRTGYATAKKMGGTLTEAGNLVADTDAKCYEGEMQDLEAEYEELAKEVHDEALRQFIDKARKPFSRDAFRRSVEKAAREQKSTPRPAYFAKRKVYQFDAKAAAVKHVKYDTAPTPTLVTLLPSTLENWEKICADAAHCHLKHTPMVFYKARLPKETMLNRPSVTLPSGKVVADPFWSPFDSAKTRHSVQLNFSPEIYKSEDCKTYGVRLTLFNPITIYKTVEADSLVGQLAPVSNPGLLDNDDDENNDDAGADDAIYYQGRDVADEAAAAATTTKKVAAVPPTPTPTPTELQVVTSSAFAMTDADAEAEANGDADD